MHEIDAHAVALCGLLAKADRAHLEAAARPIEPEVASDAAATITMKEIGNKADPRLKRSMKSSLIAPNGDGRK